MRSFLPWGVGVALLATACAGGLTQMSPPSPPPAPTATSSPTKVEGSPPGVPIISLPAIADVVERVRPAVVSVFTEQVTLDTFSLFGFGQREMSGQGSGVIFDEKGYVLTNHHVVEGASRVQINLPDDRVFTGEIVGSDPPTDLAVIRIEGRDLPVAELGTTADLRVGDWVVAIGNPLGVGISVTQGIVSALDRDLPTQGSDCRLEGVIQTDAAINPGNSGGPLLDLNGRVVGINTAIAQGAQGIGYAISIDEARPIIDQLIERGRVSGEPWIGIGAQTLTAAMATQFGLAAREGVLVRQVYRGTPAALEGLRPGDVITHLDGQPLQNREDLQEVTRQRRVGDQVVLAIDRSGQGLRVDLRLGEMPRICS